MIIALLACLLSAISAEAGTAASPIDTERRVERRVVSQPMLQSGGPVATDEKVEMKAVTGLVSGVGPGFIAVEFQRDEKKGASLEMALPVDEKALVSQKDTLKMLHLGDTVAVEYQERTAKDDRGEYAKVKRAATRITLVKRAADAATTGTEGSRAE